MTSHAQLNPYTSTRRAFTDHLTNRPIPSNASPEYTRLCDALKSLLSALLNHPAMAPNADQTYMTPAAWKNKVYFMWDFVGRTLGMLYALDPSLPAREKKQWDEVSNRCAYGNMLVHDKTGMLETMCPDERGTGVQLGEDVENLAEKTT
jgi:hypothetical protein